MSHSEVVFGPFLDVASFLLADEHHFLIFEFCKAREYCSIVSISMIAVQFDEFIKDQFEIVQSLRPLFVTSNLNDIPRIKVRKNFSLHASDLYSHILDRVLGCCCRVRLRLQLGKLLFQLEDRLLKWQDMSFAVWAM